MERRRLPAALAVLAALLSATLPAPLPAGGQALEAPWRLSCSVPVVAVTGAGEGVAGRLIVTIEYPGSGKVFISTSPATRVDTTGSARVAAFAASAAAGVDMRLYNFYYELEAPSIVVGGPSAGLAMALATYYLLEAGECPPEGFAATGMILPDGTVGPVGGLKEKLEAAAEAGVETFIIPEGQEKYVYVERVTRRVGPLVVVENRPVEVDLVDYGRSLGVEVVPAATLLDAARALGLEGARAPPVEVEPPGYALEALKDYVTSTIGVVDEVLSEPYNALEEEAARLRGEALGDLEEGLVYSAAVKATIALAYALASDSVEKAVSAGSYDVTSLVERAEEEFLRAERAARSLGEPSVEGLDAALKAYGVLAQASFEYKLAVESLVSRDGRYYLPVSPLGGVDVTGAVHAALVIALSNWSIFWSSLASSAGGDRVPLSDLESLASLLEAQASSTAAYAIQLAEETGRGGYERVAYLASLAVSAEDPLEAAGYSIEAIAAASTYLYEAFGIDAGSAVGGVEELAARLMARAPEQALAYPKLALSSLQGFGDPLERLATASKALLYTVVVSMASQGLNKPPATPAPGSVEVGETQTPVGAAETREPGGAGEAAEATAPGAGAGLALLLLAVAVVAIVLGAAIGAVVSRLL